MKKDTKKKEILCNKNMNEFIIKYFYKNDKNNSSLENIKDNFLKLNIKDEKNDNNSIKEELDIITILFSLVNFVEKYKNKKIERDKIEIVDNFIESNKKILEYYNKYFKELIKEKG